jgi:hypothetical protein
MYDAAMSSTESKAESLIEYLSASVSDEKTFLKEMDRHQSCFEADLCEVCEFLDENEMGNILRYIGKNPTITEAIQRRLLDESYKWDGMVINAKLWLAANPALAKSVVESLLHPEIWYGYGYGHEIIDDFYDAAMSNPNFPQAEFDAFIEECVESYEYPNE